MHIKLKDEKMRDLYKVYGDHSDTEEDETVDATGEDDVVGATLPALMAPVQPFDLADAFYVGQEQSDESDDDDSNDSDDDISLTRTLIQATRQALADDINIAAARPPIRPPDWDRWRNGIVGPIQPIRWDTVRDPTRPIVWHTQPFGLMSSAAQFLQHLREQEDDSEDDSEEEDDQEPPGPKDPDKSFDSGRRRDDDEDPEAGTGQGRSATDSKTSVPFECWGCEGGNRSAGDGTRQGGASEGRHSTRSLSASSATQREIEAAKQSRADGSKPVEAEKRPYRAKVKNVYEEPDFLPDEMDLLDPLFGEYGNVLYREKRELPPRDDVIKFDPTLHQNEFDETIQWEDCPQEFRPVITQIIQDHWDAFTQEGMKKPIRGFQFNVDTGQVKPISCKPPRYGKHESRIITILAAKLEANGLIEDDDGPWGALVVLAAKPHQEHKHWSEYIWRLCVSYRPINAITRPFIFPSRRCDDSAKDIGASTCFITMDLLWGHWQVPLTEQAKSKTAFFVPNGKKRWRVMPMGATNSHPAYNAIIEELKKEWDDEAAKQGLGKVQVVFGRDLHGVGSENIVDDIILHAEDVDTLLKYFVIVLDTFIKYRVTVSLKKCRFLPKSAEFVGQDIEAEGNRPSASKEKNIEKIRIKRPLTMADLGLLIGFIGFYLEWVPNFEIRIARWREYQHMCPPNKTTREIERVFLEQVWNSADEDLKNELLQEIKDRPTLKRPDWDRRFYLKTDWSKTGKAGVLLQVDPKSEAASGSGGERDSWSAVPF